MSNKMRTHRARPRLAALAAVVMSTSILSVSAQAEDISNTDFDCLIEPKMTVMVGAGTQGVIHSVDVARNDIVERGQLLARLESKVQQASLDHARVRAQMDSEILSRRADHKLAQVNLQRIKELSSKRIVPKYQLDEAEAALQVSHMAVTQAQDNKRLFQHEFSRARQVLEQHSIRSPISGVVVEQRAFPGEFVYQNPVLSIAQIDPLRVEAIIPARYFGQVSKGMTAVISPEIDSSQTMEVKIAGTDRIIDAASGTFSVHLDLPNPDSTITGGQRCTLTLANNNDDKEVARSKGNRGAE